MAILDIFKKKKSSAEKKTAEKPVEKPKKTDKTEAAAKPKKERKITPQKERKLFGESHRVFKSPHVTEKATDLAGKNQYIFRVYADANKSEVKKAVESVFGVEVLGVRIINVSSKKRRIRRIEGFRKGYKKAIVKIKEGQKIEVLPR